jgi:hypothetical protein
MYFKIKSTLKNNHNHNHISKQIIINVFTDLQIYRVLIYVTLIFNDNNINYIVIIYLKLLNVYNFLYSIKLLIIERL